uniref:Uncharacterized protein n=1 Tax=Anguilla anguilla TaxID=7936 RepID=A0A0E9V5E3_ANGAN
MMGCYFACISVLTTTWSIGPIL